MAIDPGIFVPPFLEDENSVRARLLSAVPVGMSQEPGTWVRDFVEINIAEFVRCWTALNWMLAQCFPSWATGQQLDAHALSYGLTRGAGTFAFGRVRVAGTTGLGVPPSTVFEMPVPDPALPRLLYISINPTTLFIASPPGYVDVDVLAVNVGVDYNAPAGAVVLIDTNIALPGQSVTSISNPLPIINGSDPESDEPLRQDVLEQAQLPTGSGTMIDYIVWARETPGVSGATPYGQWDTAGVVPGVYDGRQNGSVLIAERDPNNAPVDWSVAYASQQHIDQSRQMLSMLEKGEPWIVLAGPGVLGWDTANTQAGGTSLTLTYAAAGTTLIELERAFDISRFARLDEIYLWVKATDWSKVSNASFLRILADDGNYYTAPLSTISSAGTAMPSSGSAWWLYRVSVGQFTATGAPSWAAITEVQLQVVATAAVTVNLDYLVIRAQAGNIGLGGRAPVGADATVVSPVVVPIDVTITAMVLDTGFALVDTPGSTNALPLIHNALVVYFSQLEPGQTVRRVDIHRVLHGTPGLLDWVLGAPLANISLSPLQYAQLGNLTVSL